MSEASWSCLGKVNERAVCFHRTEQAQQLVFVVLLELQCKAGLLYPSHRVEPVGWKRYDIAQAFATCPYGQLERIKQVRGGR